MDLMENDASNNASIVACLFVASVTFFPRLGVPKAGGFYRAVAYQRYGDKHADTETDERDL
jgi:hypothetical protein